MKNYLLTLQEGISEHEFGQDAVLHAVTTGCFKPSFNLAFDLKKITQMYDQLCENWRHFATRENQRGIDPVPDQQSHSDPRSRIQIESLQIHDTPTLDIDLVSRTPNQRRPTRKSATEARAASVDAEA
jgi:hypothetical protein